jgi:aminopeptidase N
VVVSDFIFGGMENTTATTMYEHILLDERAAIDIESHDLVAHELAHQWFGDLVTCKDWPHAWLNEGFATYLECIEREDRLGEADYLWAIERDQNSYLSEANARYNRPVVAREYDEPIDLFDRHLYEKGALVLHLLRTELGSATFWAGVKVYLSRHAFKSVTTTDLQRSLEEVSGRSLDRFFDQWVHRAGHPAIKARVGYEGHKAVVRFEQTQAELFELEFEIEVRDPQGKIHTASVRSSDRHVAVSISMKERPSYIGVDPKLLLVGSMQLDTSFDLASGQLKHATSARLRRQAAAWLGTRQD